MQYIGIDPDVCRSGVSTYNPQTKELVTDRMDFFSLLAYLSAIKNTPIKVVIEAGWLNKVSNYHDRPDQPKKVGEMIAKKVGANHEVGRKIVEMCEYLGIEYTLSQPVKEKVNPRFFKKLTGLNVKDQEEIDSAMLVYGK